MSHGYIDPKKIASLGLALIEEAIVAVLAQAHDKNKDYLTNKEISERAGIHCHQGDYGIVRMLAGKLNGEGKISNRRDYRIPRLQHDQWKLNN